MTTLYPVTEADREAAAAEGSILHGDVNSAIVKEAVLQRYMLNGETARNVSKDYPGLGTHTIYSIASVLRRRFSPIEPQRLSVIDYNRSSRSDVDLMQELANEGATEVEIATFFGKTPEAVRKQLRKNRLSKTQV